MNLIPFRTFLSIIAICFFNFVLHPYGSNSYATHFKSRSSYQKELYGSAGTDYWIGSIAGPRVATRGYFILAETQNPKIGWKRAIWLPKNVKGHFVTDSLAKIRANNNLKKDISWITKSGNFIIYSFEADVANTKAEPDLDKIATIPKFPCVINLFKSTSSGWVKQKSFLAKNFTDIDIIMEALYKAL